MTITTDTAAALDSKADYGIGFETLTEEGVVDSLELDGRVPDWLGGSLYRIGPAQFEVGERTVNHWFDGYSMLHRFAIADGRVSYANRFLGSRAYRAANESGEISYSEFATDPCRSLFKRVASVFNPKISDNANVNLVPLGDEVVAMTETPLPVIFDRETLEAAGVASTAPGQHTTAHPHFDPATREALFYATKFGPRSTYRLYARADSRRQRQVAKTPVSRPAYMHSFGISERFAVLAECPLVVNPPSIPLSGRPFIENFRWKPENGTTFIVFDRSTGEVRTRAKAEPFFCFHHVNAYEEGDELVVDLVAYDDDRIVRSLYLKELRSGGSIPTPELRRYRVPLDGGEASGETIAEGFELPRINYRRHNGRPYRYVYGNGPGEAGGFLDTIQKGDVVERSTVEWSEPGAYPGEPVFVPAPDAEREDDGVLLSLVLDAPAQSSFLLVLDAGDLSEVARARVPHAIPFGFHGQFLSG
jgi:carotenoid cleavage dioxygenase-like enzyme